MYVCVSAVIDICVFSCFPVVPQADKPVMKLMAVYLALALLGFLLLLFFLDKIGAHSDTSEKTITQVGLTSPHYFSFFQGAQLHLSR